MIRSRKTLYVALLSILILSVVERSETFSPSRLTTYNTQRRHQRRSSTAVYSDVIDSSSPDFDVRSSLNIDQDRPSHNPPNSRRINLTWCNKVSCRNASMIREIVGEQNQISFRGSATGQVMFSWDRTDNRTYIPRVLLLVKKNDESLIELARKAIRDIISGGDIIVEVTSDVASQCNFHESELCNIRVVDPTPVHGLEGLTWPSDDYTYEMLDSSLMERHGESNPDLVCTLGGDGLLLYASMLFPGPCPPILCVAGGSLGFLTLFTRDEMVDAIKDSLGLLCNRQDMQSMSFYPSASSSMYDGKSQRAESKTTLGLNNCIRISMRMRLNVIVTNQEGIVQARYNVLNEVVIDRARSPYLASLECFVDDVHMTTVQGDGIIFSTPTGSTAYSMSAGGSVCHPAVPAILVTPICPHVLSFRSMIFPDHVTIRCYVSDDARADAAIAFDGKHRRELKRGDNVLITMCKYPVPTINKIDHSADWLSSLKKNFSFNARPRQEPL